MILLLLFQLSLLAGDADAIIRESRHFTFIDAARGRLTVKEHVKVLNKEGRDYGHSVIYYNKFIRVRNIKSTLTDASGKVVSTLRSRDITDQSATGGSNLIDDSRVKYFEMSHDVYPYVVETEYQLDFSGMLGLPSWTPGYSRAAIEQASYTIDVPSTVPIQFAHRNIDIEPTEVKMGNRTIYTWEVRDMPVLKRESSGPPWAEVAPYLVVSARDFRISGKQGSLESWSSLGLWINELWKGRDALPQAEIDKVKALIADASTQSEKVRRIYSYLQKNTRYVSIQLGIGGWQTEEAKHTVSTKYGDCKALTNYMMAMLRAVGIEAYPALINLGNGVDVMADIPNNRFNHVVLFVPMDGDSLFLECTSKDYPMGYLGLENAGKNSLIVYPTGGQLVKSPTLRREENQQYRTGTISLDVNGNASASFNTLYTGYQHDDVRSIDTRLTPREKDQAVRRRIAVPRFDLNGFVLRSSPDSAKATLDLELTLPTYANKAGNRLIFQPNVLEQRRFTLNSTVERTQPVRFLYTYLDRDELRFKLPASHKIESLPAPVEVDMPFATFRAEYVDDGDVIIYRRYLEIKEDAIPVESYEDYRQFVNTMVQSDQSRVVLIMK